MSSKAKKKKGIEPKLRFPEFRNVEGWDSVPLANLLCVRQERKPPTIEEPLFSLTIEDGITAKSARYNREFLVSSPDKKKYKIVKPKDIVYNPSNLRWGAISYSKLSHSVVVSPIYEVLYVKDTSKTDFYYMALATMRDEQIKQFVTKAQGTLVERIAVKIESFLETSVPLPSSIAEQKKIANCLSSLNELIEFEDQKLKLLQCYQKGVAQEIFPAESKTKPNLRFSEFRDTWKLKALTPYLEDYSERVPANTKLPIYSSTRTGLKPQKDYYDDREIINEGEYGVVPEDYFVYRHMSDDGTFKFNINKSGSRIAVSKEYPVFRTIDLNAEFFLYKLNYSRDFKKFALEQKKGGTRTRLYFNTLSAWKTLLPSLAEQKKIADLLSSIEELIAVQSQKLNALLDHKKGLMQQLFPEVSEVQE